MDNLKKYLQQHAEAMDIDAPGNIVWERIAGNTAEKKPAGKLVKLMVRFAVAASVVAVMVLGIKIATGNKEDPKIVANKPTVIMPQNIATDTIKNIAAIPGAADRGKLAVNKTVVIKAKKTRAEDERYAMMNAFKTNYSQLVNYQLSSIRSTPLYAENPAYFDDFKIRLRQMDLDEMNIRGSIRQKGISNILLEQLINVYQQKLDVLKSLQAEINKMNTRVKPDSTGADSLKKYYLNI